MREISRAIKLYIPWIKAQEVIINILSLCRAGGWTASQVGTVLRYNEVMYTHYFSVFRHLLAKKKEGKDVTG